MAQALAGKASVTGCGSESSAQCQPPEFKMATALPTSTPQMPAPRAFANSCVLGLIIQTAKQDRVTPYGGDSLARELDAEHRAQSLSLR